jgi:cytoskeletal protein CcmA (bactofilin family)
MALLSKDRETDRGGPRTPETRQGDASVVTKDMRIEGDVEVKGRLRLEGTVTGSVRARSIDLAATGSVEGDVVALTRDDDKEAFVIDGTVHGAVRARHVEVGEAGAVLGGIETDHATVRGRIQGGIQARDRLSLKATAVVEGDIDARRLALEEGGQVNGNIRIGDRAALKEAPVDRPAKTAESPADDKGGRAAQVAESRATA